MIEFITSGFYTSIQDHGRLGYRNKGIPLSGVMDMESASFANKLVGNPIDAAVIEYTVNGPMLRFHKDVHIAITGAFCTPVVNDVPVEMNKEIYILKNSTLKIGTVTQGMRGYIAIKGVIDTEIVLGSKSQYKGITAKASMTRGDFLPLLTSASLPSFEFENLKPSKNKENILKVYKGPEYDLCPKAIRDQLESLEFLIAPQSNRMGYVLKGLERNVLLSQIITVPVQPGTVQCTPSGDLIVLMRDCQTTGGYPRVLQMGKQAINVLSQKRPMEKVKMQIIDF